MRNPVPRIAAIHDMSGFGRTSLTVAIPILSCMGIQVCPMPTAVLSTHTVEFTDYTLCDLTPELGGILDHWERLGLHFDGVYSGFMASPEQMDSAARCIRNCLAPGGLAVVDPVLGDNGILAHISPPTTPARGTRSPACSRAASFRATACPSHWIAPSSSSPSASGPRSGKGCPRAKASCWSVSSAACSRPSRPANAGSWTGTAAVTRCSPSKTDMGSASQRRKSKSRTAGRPGRERSIRYNGMGQRIC